MKTRTLIIAAFIFALIVVPAMAMQASDSSGTMGGHDMKSGQKMDQGAQGMKMDQSGMGGMFKHHDSMDGMNADFQVMSLASMNMTSDKGETHHIMVNLSQADGGAPIKDAVGKIKVIGPDGKEQISTLKNYNGILAGNFTFKEPGKYGVICLLKNGDKKPVFKFWYEHMQ
jgi:hypothetical protein